MIDITKIYPEDTCWWSEYQPMIDAFGKVVIQIDDDNYQGDTRVLYDNDGRIGHLIFGWGSCSGCDALQACNTPEEVQELCNELEADIKWFDTKEEALEWFETHDWEGDWYGRDRNTMEYVAKAIEYLKGDEKITIEDVEKAWARFDKLKEEAEQYMFVDILLFDIKLKPYYNDLKENWDEDHARIFMKGMKTMFEHFGIKE